jgi:hypothetical protein
MPVPGDLPVMLEIALAVCRDQAARHRLTTLVVPDRMTSAVRRIVDETRPSWSGPLELVLLPRPERWFLPILNNGWRNHGVQLIAATAAAPATHLILHDADLFMFRDDFLDTRYEECRDRALACLGVEPVVWDGWYEEHGRQLAATWELCASVDWLRSFPPAMHLSHDGEAWGETHTFDTTLHPQALTDKERIAVSGAGNDLVHFGFVTATYRLWQRRRTGEDGGFVHLLLRVLIESFAKNREGYEFPSAAELAAGLWDPEAPIRYPGVEDGRAAYTAFRTELSRALDGPWLGGDQRSRAEQVLAPFDSFYSASTDHGSNASL